MGEIKIQEVDTLMPVQNPSKLVRGFRLFLFLVDFVMLILMLTNFGYLTVFFFTNWGFTASTISMLGFSLIKTDSSSVFKKRLHFVFTIAAMFQTIIFIVHFGVLQKHVVEKQYRSG